MKTASTAGLRSGRASQLPLLVPPRVSQVRAIESKGVVYTKRWVVELLLEPATVLSSVP